MAKLGVIPQMIPGGDVYISLEKGTIDGAEWIGPWPDISMGLDQVADYYYHPGFHEPSSNLTLGINKTLWDGLSGSERTLIETAARAEFVSSLAEFNAENVKWLKILRANERIKIRRFDDALLKVLAKVSAETLADQAAKDLQTRKVYDSYTGFMAEMIDWGELAETGYSNARRLVLGSRRQL